MSTYDSDIPNVLHDNQLGIKGGFSEHAPSNARNITCVAEIKAFKEHIKTYVADLNMAGKALTTSLLSSSVLLEQKLPKAYINVNEDVGTEGSGNRDNVAHAVSSANPCVGEAVNKTEIKNAADALNSRLQTEVIAPLEKWLEAFHNTKDKNHKLEDVRLNYDSSIKAHVALENDPKKDDPKKVAQLQAAKEKEEAYKSNYILMEEEVNRECLDLLARIQSLRETMGLGMKILSETMSSCVSAFDPKAPPIVIELPKIDPAAPQATAPPAPAPAPPAGGYPSLPGAPAPPAPPAGGYPPLPGAPPAAP